jgi:hypothetical protein
VEAKKKSPGKGCLIAIAIIIFLALVVPTDWVHTGSECKICHHTYTDASDYGITWTSADESVAIVNDKGEVEAKSEGKTIIIATAENGVSAQYSVEVTPMSVWQQLTADEKAFVNDVLPYMNNFKNPESVRFTDVRGYALLGTGASNMWFFTASAQNGFGGNTSSTYMLSGRLFFETNELKGTQYRANLITQAVHEKLGY